MTATDQARAALAAWLDNAIRWPVAPEVRAFADALARDAGALAVLFYGSNLRSGALDGVLDFYLLLPGAAERGIWPRVSYHERARAGGTLRAKAATLTLARFVEAAGGALLDTTIWARFVQPSALVFARDDDARRRVAAALASAAVTAARLAAALEPGPAAPARFWTALFAATYRAELRVETSDRAEAIHAAGAGWFGALLPLAWDAGEVRFASQDLRFTPMLPPGERARMLAWWRRRVRAGKPLNLLRLTRAAFTFDGAARYAAWKIERHSGVRVPLTPWREAHPLLAAPGVLWTLWRARRRA